MHGPTAPFTLTSADGWVMLVPKGEFPGSLKRPDGSIEPVVQVFDDQALSQMAASFPGEALIDYEHHSDNPALRSTAAGWINGPLQVRADGLWGLVRWSETGREDLQSGRYRYLSPSHNSFARLGEDRVRPLSLDGAGLTNVPNLRRDGLPAMPALSNRQTMKTSSGMWPLPWGPIEKRLAFLPDSATDDQCIEAWSRFIEPIGGLAENDLKARALRETEEHYTRSQGGTLDRKALRALAIERHPALFPDESAESTRNRSEADSLADRIEAEVQSVRNRFQTTYEEAWQFVRNQRPEWFAPQGRLHNALHSARAAELLTNRQRADESQALVLEIQQAQKLTYRAAWEQAKVQRPDLFQ